MMQWLGLALCVQRRRWENIGCILGGLGRDMLETTPALDDDYDDYDLGKYSCMINEILSCTLY